MEDNKVELLQPEHLAVVWEENKERLLNYAYRLCNDPDRGRDLVQTAFSKLIAFVTKPNHKVRKAEIDKFLFSILRNSYFDELKSEKKEMEAIGRMQKIIEGREEAQFEVNEIIYNVQSEKNLSERQKEVFMLRFFGKCKIELIAEEMQVSTATVKRDLQEVANFLNDKYPTPVGTK